MVVSHVTATSVAGEAHSITHTLVSVTVIHEEEGFSVAFGQIISVSLVMEAAIVAVTLQGQSLEAYVNQNQEKSHVTDSQCKYLTKPWRLSLTKLQSWRNNVCDHNNSAYFRHKMLV